MFVCPDECEECEDKYNTGNWDLLDILAASDMSLVADMCNAGIGIAPYCEDTCDNIIGGFCSWGTLKIDCTYKLYRIPQYHAE